MFWKAQENTSSMDVFYELFGLIHVKWTHCQTFYDFTILDLLHILNKDANYIQ